MSISFNFDINENGIWKITVILSQTLTHLYTKQIDSHLY
ncbi:unnamed protein product [Phyllotreta striolata]|uniref:Uncharacterized protein n=1 Tax=Phyllotreta striolata TaxID=444603 RepID=A0A9N9TF94_PHYSR|nr:unnamed protein product [Phyllotreta striolata]